MDPFDYPALVKPNIQTVKSHGRTYRVFDGTYYDADTPDKVIQVLHNARKSGLRIRIHLGYTKVDTGREDSIGRDWLDESDAEGRIGRSIGPVKVPLMIASTRSTGGPAILTACIVKITTTGKHRQVLYQHPAYHTEAITIQQIERTFNRGKVLTAAVLRDGEEHAAFESEDKARRWIARMGLTLSE